MIRWSAYVLAFVALSSMGVEAASFPRCLNSTTLDNLLRQQYGEAPIGMGVLSSGSLLELWVSNGGETWTVVIRIPNSESVCIVAEGDNWRRIPPRLQEALL